MSKRILVCGGRDFSDFDALCKCLDAVNSKVGIAWIIHGAAKGADSLSGKWADAIGIQQVRFPANWDAHGKKAGPIRNKQMLDEGKPDGVVAFPGGRGTADMIAQAKAAGVKVWEPMK